MVQTEREAFVGTRSLHFHHLMLSDQYGPVPFSIARHYWNMATKRAERYMALGTWKNPVTVPIWNFPKDCG